jgi:hypothetical protein
MKPLRIKHGRRIPKGENCGRETLEQEELKGNLDH